MPAPSFESVIEGVGYPLLVETVVSGFREIQGLPSLQINIFFIMLIKINTAPQVHPLSSDNHDRTAHYDEIDGSSCSALLCVFGAFSSVKPLATLGSHTNQLSTYQTQSWVMGHSFTHSTLDVSVVEVQLPVQSREGQ